MTNKRIHSLGPIMTKIPAEKEAARGGRLIRFLQGCKRHPIAVALVLAALTGLALGWNWLATSGLLLLAVAGAACVLICVVGMHGSRRKGKDDH